MEPLGKSLVIAGLAVSAIGLLLWLAGGKGWLGWIGRLPGDIRIQGEHGGFYFPLTTCVLLSVLLSLLFALFRRFTG